MLKNRRQGRARRVAARWAYAPATDAVYTLRGRETLSDWDLTQEMRWKTIVISNHQGSGSPVREVALLFSNKGRRWLA